MILREHAGPATQFGSTFLTKMLKSSGLDSTTTPSSRAPQRYTTLGMI